MNYLILILSTFITFGFLLLFFKFFGKAGLYAFIGISVIVANILVTQTIEIFSIVITHGNAMYQSSFLATDILSECYDKKTAKKAVYLGFLSTIMTLMIMFLTLMLKREVTPTGEALKTLFTPFLRITAGSLIAYLISNFHDVYSFEYLKNKRQKALLFRNICSTLISQLIDTLIFCTIAFYGTYTTKIFVSILVSTYVLKFVLTFVANPFFAIAVKKIYPALNE